MEDLLTGLITGSVAGIIIGWVVGHWWASAPAANSDAVVAQPTEMPDDPAIDPTRIGAIAEKIQSLAVSVARDVSDHQHTVADITTDLQHSAECPQTDQIITTVAKLVAANRTMQQRLDDSQTQFREQSRQLRTTEQLANTDALTGLANRRVFDQKIAEMVAANGSFDRVLALIDIDRFKVINDCFGHQTGDHTLVRLAERIIDKYEGRATCVRYGGEEFAILAETDSWRDLVSSLDQLRQQMGGERFIATAPEHTVTFSSGVAIFTPGETVEAWIGRADEALYAAKNDGRNAVYVSHQDQINRFSPPASPAGPSSAAAKVNGEPISPVDSATNIAVTAETTPASAAPASREQVVGGASGEAERLADACSTAEQNRLCLLSQLRSMTDNIDLNHVSIAALAVRLPDYRLGRDQSEKLLDCVRGLLRAIDRVGYDDDRTLMIFIVTSNIKRTQDRAEQLLDQINASLIEMMAMPGDQPQATMGVSVLQADQTADEVIELAIRRAIDPTAIPV
jgi:diguanylate cyclase